MLQIPPRLLCAYRRTGYRAADTLVRIGRRVPDTLFIRLRSRSGVFVTAWNPMSHRMPDGWNHRMQRGLMRHLQRRMFLIAEGSFRNWREAHLLVAGDPRPILRLARRFRQRAVVIVQRGCPARLVVPAAAGQSCSDQR